MHRFIDGEDRMQQTLLPNSLEDYVSEENPVRVTLAVLRRGRLLPAIFIMSKIVMILSH